MPPAIFTVTSPKPSRPVAVCMALLCFAIGALILCAAAGLLPAHATTHETTPRWVVGCIGLVFLAGAFAPLNAAFALPNWLNQLTGIAAVAGLALVFNWVAFFPGERHFSMSAGVPGMRLGGAGSSLGGRLMFGLAAIMGDAMVVWGVWRVLRRGSTPDAAAAPGLKGR